MISINKRSTAKVGEVGARPRAEAARHDRGREERGQAHGRQVHADVLRFVEALDLIAVAA